MIHFDSVSKSYLLQPIRGNTLRTALSFTREEKHKTIFEALSDISFVINAGESVGVVGNNGAGKSTLLKLLTRVTLPTSGRVVVDGRISSLLEVGAGFHHDLSGRENIFLAGAIAGMSRHEVSKKEDEIIHFSGILDSLENPVRTYSSGMFLRLAFSVGIHLNCDILVIDEALAVGDRNFQQCCYEKINNFHSSGGTLILVSHDESQLSAVCQRGIVLSQGHLCYDGKLKDALDYNLTL